MLKEKGQEWGIWERKIVLEELSHDCTKTERDAIFEEISKASSISACMLKNVPKSAVYLFSIGGYSYLVLTDSEGLRDLFIVI